MPESEILDLDPRHIMLLPSTDPRRIEFEDAFAEKQRAECEAAAARVAAAVDDVIRSSSVAQLVAQARALQDDLIGRRLVLYYLFDQGLVGEREQRIVADLLGDGAIPTAVSIDGSVIGAPNIKVIGS